MRRRARVVRIVDEASDAGIDAAERGSEIADVHVLRLVEGGKAAMRGAHVVADGCAVGNNAVELALPGVAVAIDHPRDNDHAGGIDDDRIPALGRACEVGTYSGDALALDQNVPGGKVTDAGVHRDDGAAADQGAAAAVAGGAPQSVECGVGTGAALS
jgi:hypothetical protein